MSSGRPGNQVSDYGLDEWERTLTINVGLAYVCRLCGNRVMVTRGGAGVLDLVCCGQSMEKVATPRGAT